MIQPLTLIQGDYADPVFTGPGVATFDFSVWAEARFVCPALGIVKATGMAADAEVTGAGANLTVHIVPADLAGKSVGIYACRIQVRPASPAAAWRDVAGVGALTLIVVA